MSFRKCLIVGIDAACWDYLEPLLVAGRLPNLERQIGQGSSGILESVNPPITPVAWSTIATGKLPGKHGVYEWTKRIEGTYDFGLVHHSDRNGIPFWETLGEAGVKVGLVNIPLTYPPPAVNGFVMTGFGAPPGASNLTFPSDLFNRIGLTGAAYKPAVEDALLQQSNPSALFRAERSLQLQQVQKGLEAASVFDVNLLMLNLMFMDHANHYFSDMKRVEEAIVCCDADLGALIDGFAPDTVFLISDHGSRRTMGKFLLGLWLRDRGFLSWPQDEKLLWGYRNWLLEQLISPPKGFPRRVKKVFRRLLTEIWHHSPRGLSNAFWRLCDRRLGFHTPRYWASPEQRTELSQVYAAGTFGCLFVNQLGREPSGLIAPQDKAEFLESLRKELAELSDPLTGDRIFRRVSTGEELYGPEAGGLPPDLFADGFDSQWTLSFQFPPRVLQRLEKYFVAEPHGYWGDHSSEGVFVVSGEEIATNPDRSKATLADIAATVLHYYGIPIPSDYDGRPLTELMTSTRRVTYQEPAVREAPESTGEAPVDEEDSVLERLRRLGYLQ